jgi:hypothetical protein
MGTVIFSVRGEEIMLLPGGDSFSSALAVNGSSRRKTITGLMSLFMACFASMGEFRWLL